MDFINYFLDIFSQMGYIGIILLMAVESSFIPFPSEVVIPPAGYLASQGEMNIWLVIISGVIGSLIGAIFNYFFAMFLGRALIYKLSDHKIAKMMMIDSGKVKKAEDYFLKYGNISTLIGRLITVVRQLISLPAGFVKMNFFSFLFYTFIGSAIWTAILATLGYFFGANKDRLMTLYHELSYVGVVIGILFVLFLIFRKKKKGWFFFKK